SVSLSIADPWGVGPSAITYLHNGARSHGERNTSPSRHWDTAIGLAETNISIQEISKKDNVLQGFEGTLAIIAIDHARTLGHEVILGRIATVGRDRVWNYDVSQRVECRCRRFASAEAAPAGARLEAEEPLCVLDPRVQQAIRPASLKPAKYCRPNFLEITLSSSMKESKNGEMDGFSIPGRPGRHDAVLPRRQFVGRIVRRFQRRSRPSRRSGPWISVSGNHGNAA
ncbi:unnamed protein product, partial [Nesidiocoris tenuis]